MVLINAHRQTAIVLTQGPAWVTCIRMQDGQLTTTRLSQESLEGEGWRELDYPVAKAARQYLKHPGGVSDAARRALEHIIFWEDP